MILKSFKHVIYNLKGDQQKKWNRKEWIKKIVENSRLKTLLYLLIPQST